MASLLCCWEYRLTFRKKRSSILEVLGEQRGQPDPSLVLFLREVDHSCPLEHARKYSCNCMRRFHEVSRYFWSGHSRTNAGKRSAKLTELATRTNRTTTSVGLSLNDGLIRVPSLHNHHAFFPLPYV